jgi:hypothetical protein
MKDIELPKVRSPKLIQTVRQEGHVSTDWLVWDFDVRENECVLRRELPKPEVSNPRRVKVLSHDGVTWR